MLELSVSSVVVIRCFAAPTAIQALQVPEPAFPCRVAPDELLVLGPSDTAAATLAGLAGDLAESDPGGIALDQTDAFTLWTLVGDAADEAFARLSAIPLPPTRPCFLQGLVGHVPAKTLALASELHILVSSPVGHYVRDQILNACADLAVQETAPHLFGRIGVTT